MITAQDFMAEASRCGFDFYAGVPCSFLTPFINYVIQDQSLRKQLSTKVRKAGRAEKSGATCSAANKPKAMRPVIVISLLSIAFNIFQTPSFHTPSRSS